MAAAEQNHIPTAFIIGRSGRLEWFGAPADIDEPLKKIVAGTWNMAAARVKSETVRRQTQILSAALEQFEPAVEAAETSGNWDKPLAIINILLKSEPNEFSYQITKLELLNKAGRLTQFDKAAAALVQTAWGNPETLESIAWTIAAEQTHPQRDLKLALKAALQANALSENKNASMLDTLARVYFESGQLEQAIKLERKAIALEPDNSDWRDALKMFQQTDKTKSRQQDNAGRVEANSETE